MPPYINLQQIVRKSGFAGFAVRQVIAVAAAQVAVTSRDFYEYLKVVHAAGIVFGGGPRGNSRIRLSGYIQFIRAKEALNNCLCGMKREAHGAQEPRHM